MHKTPQIGNNKIGDKNMRKYAIIPVIIIGAISSFFIGFYLFKISNVEKEQSQAMLLDESNTINNEGYISIKVNTSEDKITPNTTIIKKVYYIDCEHIKQKEEKASENLINMTKSEFQTQYIGWEIQRFTNSEVVIYKEVHDYCGEHYLIKEENGKIVVYKIDKYDKEIEKIEETEIETNYLTEADLEKIKEGIKVYSKKEVSKFLEDFE